MVDTSLKRHTKSQFFRSKIFSGGSTKSKIAFLYFTVLMDVMLLGEQPFHSSLPEWKTIKFCVPCTQNGKFLREVELFTLR